MNVRIHRLAEWDRIPWDDPEYRAVEYNRFIYRYFAALRTVSPWAVNLRGEWFFCALDGMIVPIYLNTDRADEAYTGSVFTHVVRYALYECRFLPNRTLRVLMRVVVRSLGYLFGRGARRYAYVMNLLVSTNLYPSLSTRHIERLTSALTARFPRHAIVFRSVLEELQPGLARTLRRRRYRVFLSRIVYLLDTTAPGFRPTRDLKKDGRLAERSRYVVEEVDTVTMGEARRIEELYNRLYIEKYSPCNPMFTSAWFFHLINARWLTAFFLRERGSDARAAASVVGVCAYFAVPGWMTAPVLGYETALADRGLYRMLTHALTRRAIDMGVTRHMSSGVGEYKRNRGGRAAAEYQAIYVRHLPLGKRWPYALVERMARGVGEPLLRAVQL